MDFGGCTAYWMIVPLRTAIFIRVVRVIRGRKIELQEFRITIQHNLLTGTDRFNDSLCCIGLSKSLGNILFLKSALMFANSLACNRDVPVAVRTKNNNSARSLDPSIGIP